MQHAVTAGGATGSVPDAPGIAGFHALIEKRLAELRSARGGRPVYGLEHGLSAADITHLNRLVGTEIRERGLGTNFDGCYLALIAAASEVGYGYRGTGTDFWPRFEAVLGARIGDQERRTVSDLFETAHRINGVRKPVDSPWARVFRHIAWPIGNAVAPKEIHRGLAQALRESYRLGGDVPDEEILVSRLRSIAGRVASPRLVRWLEDADLAAAVAWRLLDEPDPHARIAEDTLRRIFGDLSTDSVARTAVASATALHRRRAQPASKRRGEPGRTRLVIRDTADGSTELLAALPYFAGTDRHGLRAAMARAGLRPRLWGMVAPVDSDALFSGVPIALGDVDLSALCDEAPPFIPVTAAVPAEVADALLRLAPDLSLPIVLVPSGSSSQFVQMGGRIVPEGAFRLLARPAGEPPANVARKRKVGGLACFEIKDRDPAVNAWLESLGLVRCGAGVEFGGAVELGYNLHGPVFPEGQTILIQVTGAPLDKPAVLTMRGIPPLVLPAGQIASIGAAPRGEHVVEVDVGGDKLRSGFTVVPAEPAAEVLSASLDPPAPTADDVIDGRLALHLRFALPLRGVELAVMARSGGYQIARAVERIAAGPTSFPPGSALMQSLAEQLRQAGVNHSWQLELAVDVGGVWTRRWPLGWELRHCEWELVDGEWRALAEDRELVVELTSGAAPLDGASLPDDDGTPVLRTPVLDGISLPGEALCTAPASTLLGGFPISLPAHVLREPDSRDGTPGVLASVASWLAWASAKPEHIVADIGRRRIAARVEEFAVAQLCGTQWAELEADGSPLGTDFWSAVTRVAMDRGLAAGGLLPDVEPGDRPTIERLVAEALERTAPHLRDGAIGDDPERLAGDLDMAVIEAYEEFGRQLLAEGRTPIEDPDANGTAEAWLAAIRGASDRYRASNLATLILPTGRALELMRIDYRHLTDRDLLALLVETHVDLLLRPPNWLGSAAIETALSVWIDPRSVVGRTGWQDPIRRLVSDRQTARAVRYVALRYRAARGLELGIDRRTPD